MAVSLPRIRIPEIALGALMAVALIAMGGVFGSSQPSNPIGESQPLTGGDTKNRKSEIGESFWQRTLNDPVAIFTLSVAAFTAILGISTIGLWRVTRRSVQIAQDALISTERAFVFLEDLDPDWSVHTRGGSVEFGYLNVKPRWRNNGTTPTRNMTMSVNWTHWGGDLPAGFPYSYGAPPVRMFLAPQATEWSESIKIPGNVATDALYERHHIFIWGRVDYEDIFDDTAPHFTQWCYRLRFLNPTGQIQTQFVACGDYNKSDEDGRSKRGA